MIRNAVKKSSFPLLPSILVLSGFLLAAICIVVFAGLSEELLENETFAFDHAIIKEVRSFHSPALDKLMIAVTELGSTITISILLLIGMAWLWFKRKNSWGMLFFFIVVAGGGLLNLLLKNTFQRARPTVNQMVEVTGFSFPSGHAMGNFIFYGYLGYLIVRSKRKALSKMVWTVVFAAIVLLIGVSRIYLGVHYPSDILAGFTAGAVWLLLCIAALELVYFYQRKRKTGSPAK
ncbi:phosphatase PAP2 family protein [Fictibacillus sp. Mic-4]|uniref:phosphatase PAP2 family protein n=1 Tax=Fictibacillus sp. Mic-4 TaxID=3132826 RepID=UPI003CF9BDBF